MSITFRINNLPGETKDTIVEIMKDGVGCGFIYASGKEGADLKIVSPHFAGDLARAKKFPSGIKMENANSGTRVPRILVSLDVRPYRAGLTSILRGDKSAPVLCAGCDVRKPHEHRCTDESSGARKKCECADCRAADLYMEILADQQD